MFHLRRSILRHSKKINVKFLLSSSALPSFFNKPLNLKHFHQFSSQNFSTHHSNSHQPPTDWSEIKQIIIENFTPESYKTFEQEFDQLTSQEEDSPKSFQEEFQQKYSFLYQDIKSIDFQSFIQDQFNFSEPQQQPEVITSIKLILSIIYFQQQNSSTEYFENNPSLLPFLLTSLLALKSANPVNFKLVEFCESQLFKLFSRPHPSYHHLKLPLLLYFNNRGLVQHDLASQLQGFFVGQIQHNPEFFTDYTLLYEILDKIQQKPLSFDFNGSHLLHHESPFQVLTTQDNILSGPETEDFLIQTESKTDVVHAIQTTIIKQIESHTQITTLAGFRKCLQILSTVTTPLPNIHENIAVTLENILDAVKPRDPKTLISICQLIILQSNQNFPFIREYMKESLRIIYQALAQMNLNLQQALQIYSIFRHTQTLDKSLVKTLENIINPNIMELGHASLLNVYFFYAAVPSEFSGLNPPFRDINIYVKYHFKKLSFSTLLDLVIASLQIDFQEKVDSVAYLPVFDSQIWSQIIDQLFQANPENLSVKEKAKYFRTVKLLSLVIKNDILHAPLLKEKMSSLSKNFLAIADVIESEFQKEIEGHLKSLQRIYEKEKLLEDMLFVDFFIYKKKVLEVNGPSHYFVVFEGNEEKYLENRSTAFKRKILELLGYEYFSVSFHEWFALEDKHEKLQYITKKLNKKIPPY